MTLRPCPSCGSTEARIRFEEPPFVVVRCASCGLTYLGNPSDENELYNQYYSGSELRAEDYAAASSDRRLTELYAINEQRVEYIQQIQPAGELLDVGCGRGFFLKTAREHGYETRGIDVSTRAVEYASREFGLTADVATLEELTAADERFGVVTLWHVLEHFVDPYDALRKIRSLVKPGGICIVEVPNLHSLKFMLSRSKWEGGNHPRYHRTFFTPLTLRQALERSGFSYVRRVPWSYRIPGRDRAYEWTKRGLNAVGMDAFLDVVARP